MTETPEVSNEVWIATPLCVSITPEVHTTYQCPVMVLGFHPRTKAQLHAYGPFTSWTEMDVFLREHKITLSHPKWSGE